MDNEKTIYHYWGDGETVAGVPNRDLTQSDLDMLDARAHRLIMETQIVRWDGDKQKHYRLYGKTARPSNMASDQYPTDPEKAEAAIAEQAAKDAEKAAAAADKTEE